MSERIIGKVKRVNGPVITARGISDAQMMELVRVGEVRLVGEVIKLEGEQAVIQVYEDTTGLRPGDNIYGAGMPLSVALGPGLIGTIYDGIQRPLKDLYDLSGTYLERGLEVSPLQREKPWLFQPLLSAGVTVTPGTVIGEVQETARVVHKILVPPEVEGTLTDISPEGSYTVEDQIGLVKTRDGREIPLRMEHYWPIRVPRPVKSREALTIPSGDGSAGNRYPLSPCKRGDRCHSGRLRYGKNHDPACHCQMVRCGYYCLYRLRGEGKRDDRCPYGVSRTY